MIASLAFYLFATILLASGTMVVLSRNPVICVFFLILAFFNGAGLFLLLGAEFLAMILVVVYVGAVAVLFLFVVMMLDINYVAMREGFQRYMPLGVVIGVMLLVELGLVAGGWVFSPEAGSSGADHYAVSEAMEKGVSNTHAIGRLIYTKYVYLFEGAGLVLLVAMIGAIVLTLRERGEVRRQKISQQVNRTVEECIEIRKVEPGSGA